MDELSIQRGGSTVIVPQGHNGGNATAAPGGVSVSFTDLLQQAGGRAGQELSTAMAAVAKETPAGAPPDAASSSGATNPPPDPITHAAAEPANRRKTSLFGALSSGVSGLTAQSSAMGAIADNITNVSTVGYKNIRVDFQTLVTKQTSSTLFSAGGVQSKPRQNTGVQGQLQASSSQTDISISGQGYFVVNEVSTPTIGNQFLYTRAGSFFQDKSGFLRNTAGFYLQGWPTDANGNVIPANTSLTVSNQNIVSTDYLATVNLSRVGSCAPADRIHCSEYGRYGHKLNADSR